MTEEDSTLSPKMAEATSNAIEYAWAGFYESGTFGPKTREKYFEILGAKGKDQSADQMAALTAGFKVVTSMLTAFIEAETGAKPEDTFARLREHLVALTPASAETESVSRDQPTTENPSPPPRAAAAVDESAGMVSDSGQPDPRTLPMLLEGLKILYTSFSEGGPFGPKATGLLDEIMKFHQEDSEYRLTYLTLAMRQLGHMLVSLRQEETGATPEQTLNKVTESIFDFYKGSE